jgi:hypothetical protein
MVTNLWCKKHRIGIIKIDIISYDERGYRTRQAKVAHAKFTIVYKRYKKSKVNYHLYTNFNISGSIAI